MSKKNLPNKPFPPEVKDRAVRMVIEQRSKHNSQWAAIESIAGKICCTAPTLHTWGNSKRLIPGILTARPQMNANDSKTSNERTKSYAKLIRFYTRRQFFSPRRSSTGRPSCADQSNN